METDSFYYFGERKIPIRPSTTITAHGFLSTVSAGANKLRELASAKINTPYLKVFENARMAMVTDLEHGEQAINIRSEISAQTTSLSVFETEEQLPLVITDELVVKFREEISPEQLSLFYAEFELEPVYPIQHEPNYFVLRTKLSNPGDRLELANRCHKHEWVELAQVNFIQVYHNAAADPYYAQQWSLKNTGQAGGIVGKDINVEQAWAVTQGDPRIVIAVIDTGVDYQHPDLNVKIGPGMVPKLVPGYNALENNDDQQPLPSVSHGTNCAGIATAAGNAIGIIGVAPNCRLMGIKISDDESAISNKDDMISRAIMTAVDRGADVINCSWGYINPSGVLDRALLYARQKGRQGKGCVLVFAAGNNGLKVQYPATSELVITVTSSNQWGQFKNGSSNDHEAWSCNTGDSVDLCAPGVKMITLANNRKYNMAFFGTSASAPLVAGTAALLLSVDNNLTAADVEQLLKAAARQPDGADNPNDAYGYGILDAGRAVLQAKANSLPS